jgi:hypothetical protein
MSLRVTHTWPWVGIRLVHEGAVLATSDVNEEVVEA